MATSVAANFPGYAAGGVAPGPSALGYASDDETDDRGYWSLSKCRQCYTTYLFSKRPEIDEQIQARRYRHGAHWTAEQVRILNDRKQPVVTYNRIGRKIDGIVGLTERLRQDPKAFPRTPSRQLSADLATAVLRYLMDFNKWKQQSPLISEAAAIDGIGGVELGLKPMRDQFNGGSMLQQGPDLDVTFRPVDNDGFFYDPRSFKHDFSDALYMGMGKWVDEELLKDLMPQFADVIQSGPDRDLDLTSNSDRDMRWYQDNGEFHQIRLVDLWYKHKRGWAWALFTGGTKLMEGDSPFIDEYGEPFCKYVMFSAAVDHDGDRYGFPRNLQSAQDEINQRRSKALHELNSRRIRATKAAIADNNVEALRKEAARADGILLSHTSIEEIQFDDAAKQTAIMGHLEFLKEAKSEIENFGPNPAVLGDAGISARSGRAIQLLQQAGIAELGPYMTNMRSWKLRLYTALFNAAKTYWTNERWIRVTDAKGKQQFVGLNVPQTNPMTGQVEIVNDLGQLDVDIILDEGPDTVTVMQDTYDAISQALPAIAPMLGPDKAAAVMDVLIETSPLPADVKDQFRAAAAQSGSQPDPKTQAAQDKLAIEQQSKQADIVLNQQKAAGQLQLQRAKATQDAMLEREKADNQMMIERYKAQMKAANERIAALSGPQLQLPLGR